MDRRKFSKTLAAAGAAALAPGGPAESSGVRTGDRVLAVDGAVVTDENFANILLGIPFWLPGGGENHPDTIMSLQSIWIGNEKIVENGQIVGPPELARLAETAGAAVVGEQLQKRSVPDRRTLLGRLGLPMDGSRPPAPPDHAAPDAD